MTTRVQVIVDESGFDCVADVIQLDVEGNESGVNSSVELTPNEEHTLYIHSNQKVVVREK